MLMSVVWTSDQMGDIPVVEEGLALGADEDGRVVVARCALVSVKDHLLRVTQHDVHLVGLGHLGHRLRTTQSEQPASARAGRESAGDTYLDGGPVDRLGIAVQDIADVVARQEQLQSMNVQQIATDLISQRLKFGEMRFVGGGCLGEAHEQRN
jgi:hypothetical protein